MEWWFGIRSRTTYPHVVWEFILCSKGRIRMPISTSDLDWSVPFFHRITEWPSFLE